MKTWWLSFADGDLPTGQQFLGVVIVRAFGFFQAVARTHQLGINPGGSVQGMDWPAHVPMPEHCYDRLLSRQELEDAGLRPKSVAELEAELDGPDDPCDTSGDG